jgi:tetratricopeptide (TPR) repeat protein
LLQYVVRYFNCDVDLKMDKTVAQESGKPAKIRVNVGGSGPTSEFAAQINACKSILRDDPENGGKWAELAEYFVKDKKWEKAAHCYLHVLEHAKLTPGIKGHIATVLARSGRYKRAQVLMAEAFDEAPNEPSLQLEQFRLYRLMGQYNNACKTIARLKKTIAPRRLSENNLSSEAYCNMSAGRYVRGLRFLKQSWDNGTEKTAMGWHQRKYEYPAWSGDDLTGRTIMMHCEQGLGDGLVFLRYLPQLAAMNPDKIILVLAKPLHRLVDKNPHVDLVVDSKETTPNADVQVFTFDLPLHFKTVPKTVPAPATLNIPKSSIARAKKILRSHNDTFNVGVLWTGNPKFPENPERSFPIQRFLELTDIPSLQMFSLYKGEMPAVLSKSPAREQILDVSNTDKDLADSAAFMEHLDLVITVDSAVAHLAGSVNVPVWCLLKHLPFWYYADGRNTPWYPDMRLFKQTRPRNWDNVFAQVRRALTEAAAQKN